MKLGLPIYLLRITEKFSRFIAYTILTVAALVLFVPMVWMVLSAFTPQSELQTAVPMRRTFSAFDIRFLWQWDKARSWLTSYFTTENFHSPETGTGLFDITAMPRYEFANAPVHAPIVRAYWHITGRTADPNAPDWKRPVLAGRLILWFENTLFIALAVTALSVLLNAMAGYAFAKFEFWGHKTLFCLILATIMIPGQVTLIPLFLLFTHVFGWYDSFLAVILPQVAAPVGIFLMRQYIRGLPSQLEDAARIDGCSEIGIFRHVIVPLSKPILAVWAIFTFIGAWKAFLWPLVITDNQNMFMLEVGLKTLQFTAGPRNIGVVMSAAVLASIPTVIVFFLFQKYLTMGLTIGAVKG
jgi:ABC-type glycerol-3-phosphate transport system permease component